MKTLKGTLFCAALLSPAAALAIGGGMMEAALPTKLEVAGQVVVEGNGCPEKPTRVARDLNPSFNTDHLYFFHENFVVRDRVKGSKLPRDFSCTFTATLSYEPGYRFVFAQGMTNGSMAVAGGHSLEIKTRYQFPFGGAFKLRTEEIGPSSKEFWQKKQSRPEVLFESDCSGTAVVAITKDIHFRTPAMSPGDTPEGPGDDKDDISMAFIDRDEMNIVWERCSISGGGPVEGG